MKKNLVIFDGSNFYHGVKRLSPKTHLINFDYKKLVNILTNSNKNSVEYCVGEIRQDPKDKKSVKLYANQQALFYQLEKQSIEIKKGYMLKNDGVFREKGVDVRIAIDIVRGALKNEFDRCFVISSDTDIIPAIFEAKSDGKEIIYVGFSNFVSRALKVNCSKTIIVTKQMILNCSCIEYKRIPNLKD